jgi:hypothetical protein
MTEELQQNVDSTADRYEAEKAQLFREDGSKRHSDSEHRERAGALREKFYGEMDQLEAEIGEEINRRETALVAVEFSDPADSLSVGELQRASARRELVSEDAAKLPLGELAGKMKAALASGDRAMMYLLSRSARHRVGDLEKAPTETDADQDGIVQGEEFGEAAAAVRDLVAELDQALRPAHSQAVESARQDLENSQALKEYARLRRQGYKSVMDKHFSNQYSYLDTATLR